MLPSIATHDQAYVSASDVEVRRYGFLGLAALVALANFYDGSIRQFRHAMVGALVQHLAKYVESVPLVLTRGHKFKVVRAVVRFHTVLVIVFVALWARSNEGTGDSDMDKSSRAFTVAPQADAQVILSLASKFKRDLMSADASHSPFVAHFIEAFEAFNWTPFFHSVSIAHGTYESVEVIYA